MAQTRSLVVILGDQLNRDASAFDGFDVKQDAVWMAEVDEESTHIWSSKQRIALFISAMRHFAQSLRQEKIALHYSELDDRTIPKALRVSLPEPLPYAIQADSL